LKFHTFFFRAGQIS